MSEEKGLGRKILGLFVEQAEGEGEGEVPSGGKSAADLVAELAQQSGAAPTKAAAAAPPPPGPALKFDKIAAPAAGAAIDFDAVFKDAGMDGEDLNRVRKAEELLKGLPEATPHDIKKQIVEASLKAFGFDVAKISAAAQNQKRALDAYVKVNEQLTAKGITDAQAQIAQLNEKIASLQKDIEKRTTSLSGLSRAAQTRKEQVQKVLDFFQAPVPPAPSGGGEGR
jgi:lambda repressor-like predicted transcriptional regulator